MTLAELKALLGPPKLVERLLQPSGVEADGRQQVNLSNPSHSAQQYALWTCEQGDEQHVQIGTVESIGTYCLAVENESGDWSISARCTRHEAVLPWSDAESKR